MRDRRDFDIALREIDSIRRQSIDHRPKRRPKFRFGNMLKAEKSPARGRSSAGRNFLQDRKGSDVTRCGVFVRNLGMTVFMDEFLTFAIQQAATELVTERVPHDRIHTHHPRGEMSDREELDEFHIHKICTGPQCQGV